MLNAVRKGKGKEYNDFARTLPMMFVKGDVSIGDAVAGAGAAAPKELSGAMGERQKLLKQRGYSEYPFLVPLYNQGDEKLMDPSEPQTVLLSGHPAFLLQSEHQKGDLKYIEGAHSVQGKVRWVGKLPGYSEKLQEEFAELARKERANEGGRAHTWIISYLDLDRHPRHKIIERDPMTSVLRFRNPRGDDPQAGVQSGGAQKASMVVTWKLVAPGIPEEVKWNIRSAPNTDADVKTTKRNGDTIQAIGVRGGWLELVSGHAAMPQPTVAIWI